VTDESPFKRLRLLAGVQQKDLAQRAGVSVTALVNIEAGLYETVPQRANMALARACRNAGVGALSVLMTEYGDASLDGAMRTWQRRQRQRYDLSTWGSITFEQLVGAFEKPDRFCKALCVPTAALHNYRSGKLRVMPLVIREALQDAGYPYIDEMERAEQWQQTPQA
jgi:transcriptional regulator with XRE-family HTH domain